MCEEKTYNETFKRSKKEQSLMVIVDLKVELDEMKRKKLNEIMFLNRKRETYSTYFTTVIYEGFIFTVKQVKKILEKHIGVSQII